MYDCSAQSFWFSFVRLRGYTPLALHGMKRALLALSMAFGVLFLVEIIGARFEHMDGYLG